MLLGKLLKFARFVDDVGIREYARNLGIAPSTLSRIENGKPIDAATQLKLINYFFAEAAPNTLKEQ